MRRTNLIPDDLAAGSRSRFTFKTRLDYMLFMAFVILFLVFLVVAIIQLIGTSIFSYQIKNRTRSVDTIAKELAINKRKKEDIDVKIESWQKKIGEAQERIAFLKEEIEQEVFWSDILEKLNSLLPARLWLVRVALEEKEIKIKGNSYENLLISTFISNLSSSNIFTNIDLNYTKKKRVKDEAKSGTSSREVVEFEITCNLIAVES